MLFSTSALQWHFSWPGADGIVGYDTAVEIIVATLQVLVAPEPPAMATDALQAQRSCALLNLEMRSVLSLVLFGNLVSMVDDQLQRGFVADLTAQL